jgi:aldehyde:ferredoxin oxidoreductase
MLANLAGMDTITTGTTIACAMELFEKGHITEKDTGMPLKFGDAATMVKLVEMAAKKEGFGKDIALGSYRLAEKYGHPEFSMTSKKLEFPSYDPRGGQGYALAYATNSRGGCHIRAEVHCVEMFGASLMGIIPPDGENLDRFVTDDKADVARKFQDYYTMIDSIGLCNFICVSIPDVNHLISLVETATGVSFGGEKGWMKTGERIFNLERLFNLKAGLTHKDDTLPERMLKVPMPEGPTEGKVAHLDKMLPEYYKIRGWDAKGVPSPKKLKELGLAA